MDEVPFEVFLNIGKKMDSNEKCVITNISDTTKNIEYYKKN